MEFIQLTKQDIEMLINECQRDITNTESQIEVLVKKLELFQTEKDMLEKLKAGNLNEQDKQSMKALKAMNSLQQHYNKLKASLSFQL